MRWHIWGGILCAVLGFIIVVCGLLYLGIMAYYNVQHGPIEVSNGEFEALDRIALTAQNIAGAICTLLAGVTGCAAAVFWFKARNRVAGVLTGLFFLLLGAATLLVK